MKMLSKVIIVACCVFAVSNLSAQTAVDRNDATVNPRISKNKSEGRGAIASERKFRRQEMRANRTIQKNQRAEAKVRRHAANKSRINADGSRKLKKSEIRKHRKHAQRKHRRHR